MFSGGIGSWAAARRIVDEHGAENVVCLFTDVKGSSANPHIGEDEDTYRFIDDAMADLQCEYVRVADGRDIWQVFKDEKFLGSSRQASCSKLLKVKQAHKWLADNTDPADSTVVLGIDWTEEHRKPAVIRSYDPRPVLFPMCEPPFLTKDQMIEWGRSRGIEPPRLYAMGFAHNNCGGGCVRAGQAQFAHLLRIMPERFLVWESMEQEVVEHTGRYATILRESVRGERRPLPLSVLRERVESQPSLLDDDDWGGCGCFVDEENSK